VRLFDSTVIDTPKGSDISRLTMAGKWAPAAASSTGTRPARLFDGLIGLGSAA
jgi:hypothetical protein